MYNKNRMFCNKQHRIATKPLNHRKHDHNTNMYIYVVLDLVLHYRYRNCKYIYIYFKIPLNFV